MEHLNTNLAHTIRLYPTKIQETFFKKACGCARVAYNYGLNKLRAVSPEVTPVDKEAMVYSSPIGINETVLDEAGISACTEMYM